jgi:hypothetical protein
VLWKNRGVTVNPVRVFPGLFLFGVLFAGGPALADDLPLPGDLSVKQKANLKAFLAALPKPTEFLPPRAILRGFKRTDFERQATTKGPIKEYLAVIEPLPTVDDRALERVEILWYRANPSPGKPGVTVKRVVNVNTGEEVGMPEVLFNYPTPLAVEEVSEAVKLARQQSPAVQELYKRAKNEVLVTHKVKRPLQARREYSPGDRLVDLSFREKTATRAVTVLVNLTRQTVYGPALTPPAIKENAR